VFFLFVLFVFVFSLYFFNSFCLFCAFLLQNPSKNKRYLRILVTNPGDLVWVPYNFARVPPRDLIGFPHKFARAHPRGLVGNVVVVIVF